MAKQVINVGGIANDGTGDSLRTGANKINENFTELYDAIDTGLQQINSDWNATSGAAEILNKPVLFSGDYSDLTNPPELADVALSGSYTDLTDQPHLSLVATTGDYEDLDNIPTLFSGSYSDLSNKPTLFSGSYSDLTNKPTIPNNTSQLINGASFITSAYVTWTNLTGKPSFATVATSGSYSDLTNKPTIPTAYTLPTATTSVLGGVKVDGSTITITDGVISSTGGGGTSLPSNAAGYLKNNGSGTLTWGTLSTLAESASWSDILNRPAFSIVATSGLYNDLSGTPIIPDSILDLGIVDGAAGQVLTTNGAGTFTFTTVSGGGGALSARSTVTGTTGNLANGATGNLQLTGFKSYMLMKVVTSDACWVRIYTDAASRTADSSRLEGTDPAPGAGVIAEVIATGAQTILISPGALGFNNESIVTTDINVAITNKSGSTAAITLVLHILKLEA